MYEAFFGLRQRPFTPAPLVERYFPAETIEQARVTIARCLDRAEGIAILVGPSGTGKTLLCQMLRTRLDANAHVVTLGRGRLTSIGSLYQTILFELGMPCRGVSENELRLDLGEYLADRAVGGRRLILLVDEAHTLPLKLLEELRMMTNLATASGEPHVRMLLAGNPLLEERFTHPKLEAFSQRVTTRCYLEPFRQDETRQYIHAQLDAVGGSGSKLFSTKATKAVFQATDGIPRLVNQLCDHALFLAAREKKTLIDDREVEIAWAGLQQLPTPWNDEPADTASVIEFGSLDDVSSCSPVSSSSSTRVTHKNTTTDDLLADLVQAAEEEKSRAGESENQVVSVEIEATPRIGETLPARTQPLSQLIPQLRPLAQEPLVQQPQSPSSSLTANLFDDPFCETFESEEEVVQPVRLSAARLPMVVSVDSPILTYAFRGSETSASVASELTRRQNVDVGYPHAPPSVRDKLALYLPEHEGQDPGDTLNRHLTRLFSALRRA